ncbi:MAG: hypothetical protein IH895_09130 [Planctomycetes bacterium]|nr:hypothetical protein [Planctomycetota bacterium]
MTRFWVVLALLCHYSRVVTPPNPPLSQRPKGTHRHLWEHYPSSFAGLSPKEKLRCGALKRAVEHDRVFAFRKGTAVGKFNVTEEGDYRLYMRVKWCCACGNSFYFSVDDKPLEVVWLCRGCHTLLHRRMARSS